MPEIYIYFEEFFLLMFHALISFYDLCFKYWFNENLWYSGLEQQTYKSI